jgi:hypothetical protein
MHTAACSSPEENTHPHGHAAATHPPRATPPHGAAQDVSLQLKQLFNCAPVFIDPDVRDKYYKGKRGICVRARVRAACMHAVCVCVCVCCLHASAAPHPPLLHTHRRPCRTPVPAHATHHTPHATRHTPPQPRARAPHRLLQAAAVAAVPLRAAHVAREQRALQQRALAGLREGQQGACVCVCVCAVCGRACMASRARAVCCDCACLRA